MVCLWSAKKESASVHSPQTGNRNDPRPLVTDRLHSRVYASLIGFALSMVLWVWSFVGSGETDYLLFIVSGFIGVVVA